MNWSWKIIFIFKSFLYRKVYKSKTKYMLSQKCHKINIDSPSAHIFHLSSYWLGIGSQEMVAEFISWTREFTWALNFEKYVSLSHLVPSNHSILDSWYTDGNRRRKSLISQLTFWRQQHQQFNLLKMKINTLEQ